MKIGGDVPPFFGVNAALAACLYLVDVGLNSSIEYGDLPGQDVLDNSSDSIVSFIYAVEKLRNRKYYSPEYWMRK
ncbi:hypothetical protein AM588_10001172 [Phytophthora nicotianae]|uniref:Uncharacterized protein n=1 Tax=Phytophthora nicotianae TaxID=4792 RepID=A0A0W8CRB8_PHYNI|nr:hypothetical protein AM588_10001172 [Phytophthora nicotianae]